ncbi:MAG: hypothetical protein AUJ75_04205 [Candidatus Omnitrophica bacterium CG1_02_49_10]|nr:MAG: hypothetical protein AUJ75_04205 [Candidatus Omnitrophica bacterium CG1_02_49_10]
MFYYALRFLSFLIFKIFFAYSVTGKENVPRDGAYILASNHASYLDPVALGSAVPHKLCYLARENLFTMPVLSFMLPRINAFPLKREGGDVKALRDSVKRLKEGKRVIIFPEGTRTRDGNIGEAKWGIGFLAAKSQAPIIPACIIGSDKALPRGGRLIRPHKISIHLGRPIMPEDFSRYEGKERYLNISRAVMDAIRALHREYSQDGDKDS